MAQHWYLSRNGAVYGPYPVDQVKHLAATGQVVATDYLQEVGGTGWLLASQVPGLLTPPAPEGKLPAPKAIQMTCFACYSDISVVPAGRYSVPCPKCGAVVQLAEEPKNEPANTGAAFANLEDPAERTKRLVAEAYQREAAENRIVGGIFRGFLDG